MKKEEDGETSIEEEDKGKQKYRTKLPEKTIDSKKMSKEKRKEEREKKRSD